jgi:hypothetical protein
MHVLWVLMMMTVFQGEPGTQMLGSYNSPQQCHIALVHEATKRANLSHAKGGGSFFRCSAWEVD